MVVLGKDTAETECGAGCFEQHVGVRTGQVHTGSKLYLDDKDL